MNRVQRFPKATTTLRSTRNTFRFYNTDSLEFFRDISPGSVDVIVTSPPYNLGIPYSSYKDTLPEKSYLKWTDAWVHEASRALSKQGSLFLNVGNKPTQPWTAFDVAAEARRYLNLQNTIHWIKSIAIDKELTSAQVDLERDLAVGHYKPINSDRFLNDCHEFIFHFTPTGRTLLDRQAIGVPYQVSSNITRWKATGSGVRCRGNTWFIPYKTIQNRERDRPHPATFPPLLPIYCLKLHGLKRARLVIDPFMGLGSTAVACAELGIDFIGIEMDRAYLDKAVERVRETLKKKPKRPLARAQKGHKSESKEVIESN